MYIYITGTTPATDNGSMYDQLVIPAMCNSYVTRKSFSWGLYELEEDRQPGIVEC